MNDGTIEAEAPTFRLIYRSRNQIPSDSRKRTLGDLFSEARSNNRSRRITGALMVSDDWFVQTLEGREDEVRSLYARIERDPRHDSFFVLEARPVDGRIFARWSMAEVSPDRAGQDTFLLAHKDGISPAASLRPTSEQESVLQVMRTAARASSQHDEVDLHGVATGAPEREDARLRPTSM
jgi:hypothetical protein